MQSTCKYLYLCYQAHTGRVEQNFNTFSHCFIHLLVHNLGICLIDFYSFYYIISQLKPLVNWHAASFLQFRAYCLSVKRRGLYFCCSFFVFLLFFCFVFLALKIWAIQKRGLHQVKVYHSQVLWVKWDPMI